MMADSFLDQFSSKSKWSSIPAKRIFRYAKNINEGMIEERRLSLTLNGVVDRPLDDLEGLQSSDYSTYQIFQRNDLVFKLIDLENIRTSRVGHVPKRGIMSPAYIRLIATSSSVNVRFYYWYFYSAYLNNIFNGMGGGVRQNLTPTDLLRFPVPQADLNSQQRIADFLDLKVEAIDAALLRKRSQLKLISDKISDFSDKAIMGELNDSRPFVGTDLQWLPRIPSHWKLAKAKQIFRELSEAPLPEDKIITAFRDGQVTLREKRRTDGYTFAVLETGYQHIRKGNLVIHTMDAFAGAIGVSEDDGKATGEYAVCDALDPKATSNHYYAHVLRCMARRNYIYVLCPSVRERAPRFRFVRFAQVTLPVPPFEEQAHIVSLINEQVAGLQDTKRALLSSISALTEYRTALITAAVTGELATPCAIGGESAGADSLSMDEVRRA